MANYLINSPSSNTVGTDANDLFVLQALQGNTVFGLEGNDTITAAGVAGSSVLLNGGGGNDVFLVTGAQNFKGSIFAGSGNDDIRASKIFETSTIVRGGSGNDTIGIGNDGAIAGATFNSNDGSDLLTAIIAQIDSSLIAAGKGKDTLSFVFASGGDAITVNGGAGHDNVTLSAAAGGQLSAIAVNGGDGFDTIVFESQAAENLTGAFNINGDSLDDLIRFRGQVTTLGASATIGGGAGADTIQFSAGVSLTAGFINAGAGLDSVYISGAFANGTLNGGAGTDSITLGTYAQATGGAIYGDLGADSISLGSATLVAASGGNAAVTGGVGSILGYASFDQSNLAGYDFASAGVTINATAGTLSGQKNATLFTIKQDVVTASVGSNLAVAQFTTNTGGVVTFTATFDNTLTARVVELDRVLAAGQSVTFVNGAGTQRFVFMQAGASGSGTDGDLLIRVNSADALAAINRSAIAVRTLQGTEV